MPFDDGYNSACLWLLAMNKHHLYIVDLGLRLFSGLDIEKQPFIEASINR